MTLVHDGLRLECNSLEADRLVFGERLKAAIAGFIVDYIPHMKEEEEVGGCVGVLVHRCEVGVCAGVRWVGDDVSGCVCGCLSAQV